MNPVLAHIQHDKSPLLESLLDASMDMVLVLDLDLRYFLVNQKARSFFDRIFGYSVIGKTLEDIHTQARQTGIYQLAQNALNGVSASRRAFYSTMENRYFDIDFSPVYHDLSVVAVMTVVRDVTEQVRIREETDTLNRQLSQRNSFIETIIDAIPEWVAVYDRQCRILTLNKAVESALSVNRADIVGKPLREAFPDVAGTRSEADLEKALKGEFIQNEPYVSSVTCRHIQNSIIPLYDESNEVYAALAIARDVTDILKTQEDLRQSQHHFSTLFRVSPVALSLSFAKDGTMVDVNNAWITSFGIAKENAVGRSAEELNLLNSSERQEHIREIVAEGGRATGLEIKFNVAGQATYFIANVETMEYQGNTCFLTAYFNISERRKTEETIRAMNKQLNQAQHLAHIGSWEWDVELNRVTWSDELYNIFGQNKQTFETTFEGFLQCIHPDDRAYVQKIIETASQTHQPFDFKHRTNQIAGAERIVRGRGEVLAGEDKRLIRMSGTGQDITDQVNITRELERQNAALEKMNRELASFSYVASHDLQEPLRKIQMFTKRILEKDLNHLSEDGKSYFGRIENAASRMQLLIRALLDYSSASTNEKEKEPLDLNEAWNDVVNSLKEKIEEAGAQIHADALPVITATHFQIHQLFTNLLSNSLKFSKPDTPPIIALRCYEVSADQATDIQGLQAKKHVKLVFSDNGIGFDSTYSEQIFGLFQRLHGASEYPGTGLGLAICRKIVENHGGVMLAEGIEGKGASFSIHLPLGT